MQIAPCYRRAIAARYKQATIQQWTADPCEAHNADGEPGSEPYFRALLAARDEYAPWMPETINYSSANGLRVLDIGCGQGIDLFRFAQAGADVSGVDLTPRHVQLARAHLALSGTTGRVVEGDAEWLPFEDGEFDRVSSNGVLHHTADLAAALRESHRVLRPAGEARFILYNRASLHYWINQVGYEGLWRRRLFREGSMGAVLSSGVEYSSVGARPLVRVYRPRQLRHAMRFAGFQNVETVVRHFKPDDAWFYSILAQRLARFNDPRILDRIGRLAGWYVIGTGVRTPID